TFKESDRGIEFRNDEYSRATKQTGIQIRLRHGHRVGCNSARSDGRYHSSNRREEERTRVDARVSSQGVPQLAHDDRAEALAEHQVSADRLSGHHLLQRAEAETDEGES